MRLRIALIVLCASIQATTGAEVRAQSDQGGAKAFADPTRPPNVADSADSAPGGAAPGKPRLQSVLIAPGRRVAVINGMLVPEGEAYGDATVVRVTAASVLLRRPDGDETLELLPGVEKQAWRSGKQVSPRARPKTP